mmetsp:Transcript_117594/g.305132  ORF Transcript_117594/g.305132 Transcript_117594/m.305132 type:complete len:254 (+) Transcript_117594:432-1193(+)
MCSSNSFSVHTTSSSPQKSRLNSRGLNAHSMMASLPSTSYKPRRNATICRSTPVLSQNAAASRTNSPTFPTSTAWASPPGQSAAPLAPVSTKAAASAKAVNGAGATGSSPSGCMYFRLHSGSAASSSSQLAGPCAASATIFAQAPTNSPATPSPGRGRPTSGFTDPPSKSWKKAGVNGTGTTKPSRMAFAMSLPSIRKRRSTCGRLGASGGKGLTKRPRRGVRKSSLKGGSSSTHIGASRFAVRLCNSCATNV